MAQFQEKEKWRTDGRNDRGMTEEWKYVFKDDRGRWKEVKRCQKEEKWMMLGWKKI